MLIPPPNFKDVIRADELDRLLDAAPNLQVLSLDCFDTLIWRKVATPRDVFFAMQHHPAFATRHITAGFRQNAEHHARQLQMLKTSSSEVTLHDIYLQINPDYSEKDLADLTQAEIATELEYCFAFQPVVNLIKKAHARNIKVIIVSDIYFKAEQLKMLLMQHLGDAAKMIHDVFCSVDYGRGKLNGLFEHVIKKLKIRPEAMLHIGDNYAADYVGARTQGIAALHFVQQDETINDIKRLQETTAMMFDSTIRVKQPLLSPFHALLALNRFDENNGESLVGYASLGTIIFAFTRYLIEEIAELKKSEKNLKVLFLMRDAFLTARAFEKISDGTENYLIRISRFSAVAASFRSEKDIQHYLTSLGKSLRYKDIGRQLLLPPKVLDPLISMAECSADPEMAFSQLVLRKETVRIILDKSQKFRERLLNYLKKTTGMKSGDTLLLVDLGYSATVQRLLTPILKEEGVNVVGRYLISLPTPLQHIKREGFLDEKSYDTKTLHALIAYIAWFEQLCTANESSVMDYDDNGQCIFSSVSVGETQRQQLTRIQNEALRFVDDAQQFFKSDSLTSDWLRMPVMIELARMIFLPTTSELNCIKNFAFDVNLGTKEVVSLFNAEQGLTGLRRRGLFFMENPHHTKRINYPAELRSAGFELAITHLVQNRFNFNITPKDILAREEWVAVVLHHGQQKTPVLLDAAATHDGYFSLCAPAGTGITFVMGHHFQFVEIDEVELINMEDFAQQRETTRKEMILSKFGFYQMRQVAGKLFECLSRDGCMTFEPGLELNGQKQVVRVVFRPVVKVVSEVVSQG